MKKIAIIRGSDNIWRDFGYADADVRKAKAKLARQIIAELKKRKITDREAADKIKGMDHTDISRIRNAELKRYSVDRLMRVLVQMNCHIDVTVKAVRTRKAQAQTALA